MRVLLKLDGGKDQLSPEARLTATKAAVFLEPLFEVPSQATGFRADGSDRATWYVASTKEAGGFGAASAHPWDIAHSLLRDGLGLAGRRVLAAEPDLEQDWAWPRETTPFLHARAPDEGPDGEKGDPFDIGGKFGWHLNSEHSELADARAAVSRSAQQTITIAHLDTGYDPDHLALPINLDHEREKNFVEPGQTAADRTPTTGLLNNHGHGTGTLGIPAGGTDQRLISGLPIPDDFGPIGGAPFALVVPVRIANSVVHFATSNVARGIDYARQIGADVLSMSMGGLPSDAWADAVNLAYEAGVVLVCAAGNSFGGLPTSLIVYPARFRRVIAACGVMARGHPYYGLGGPMEGCAGPPSKMRTAIAAFTPNIPWLRLGRPEIVDMDGAGTSAATPQIAAAAALWLAKNGANLPRDWRRVEKVRAALFGSAERDCASTNKPDPLFGRGLLRAAAALDYPVDAELSQTQADSASFAFVHLLTSIFGVTGGGDHRRQAMLDLEMTQLALTSRGARTAIPDPDLPAEAITPFQKTRFVEALLDENTLSRTLRAHLETQLGRRPTVQAPKSRQPEGGRAPERKQPQPPPEGGQPHGSELSWRKTDPAPARRRLRVFATDPGDSARLATTGISMATIEVPWEPLRPGPIGEYLEVVDVDPASDAAYDPVDLDHSHMLAQDGLAPSEGNPKFHQQMVYAVAMRTIRNFEVALGRRVLWAERRRSGPDGGFIPVPDGGYVGRLRIYPHGLREQNAYYSPDRKALLFGYYRDPTIASGNRTVFTCLSYDVVAHETTHALLDGLHRRYQEATNPDVLAFHEAFADIVAIFQHFTMPDMLYFEIGRTRGDLWLPSILSELARQFGRSLHNDRALRKAINSRDRTTSDDTEPSRALGDYTVVTEAHDRGAILVAAVFEAFVAIFTRRTQDLLRIATGGTGVLAAGALHPDLVARLAQTAADTAQRVLTICIRALDYMPPVDPTFGDYLRAIVTADADLAPDHGLGYRVAFAESFARRGIYPPDIANISPDGLSWGTADGPVQSARLNDFIRDLPLGSYTQSDRRKAFESAKVNAAHLHYWMEANLDQEMAASIGLDFTPDATTKRPRFEVHSVRPARRSTQDGEPRTDIVVVITQRQEVNGARVRGGCTLILDREYNTDPIRYAIVKTLPGQVAAVRMRAVAPNSLYGTDQATTIAEPFSALHRHLHSSPDIPGMPSEDA
jgi:hypothetical protein